MQPWEDESHPVASPTPPVAPPVPPVAPPVPPTAPVAPQQWAAEEPAAPQEWTTDVAAAAPVISMDSIFRDSAPVAEPEYDDDPEYDDAEEAVSGLFDSDDEGHGHGLRNALVVILCLALVGGLGILGFTKGRAWLVSLSAGAPDYPGPGVDEVIVNIPMGSSSGTMAHILFGLDVIKSEKAFTDAVKSDPSTFDDIQAGKHILKTQMPAADALAALADPTKMQRDQVTIPEGRTVSWTLSRINQITGISLDDMNAIATNPPADLGLPDWANLKADVPLQGFLFPETYAYDDTTTAASIMKSMVSQFNTTIDGLDFVAKARDEGLTANQALVLASIIQMESADPQYAPDIAQVFLNRIAKGMMLQSDATVIYACSVTTTCNSAGTTWTSSQQRNNDSPYNTYKYKGLPPGPISNPGSVALSAAVNASTGNLLYFTAIDGNGTIGFASDAAGHDANVKLMQTWCSDNPGKCSQG